MESPVVAAQSTAFRQRAAAVHERERVRRHLAGAERAARSRRPGHLSRLQATNRALLLDELARYRRQGRFPHNHDLRAQAVPEFVDSHGTCCAVAHLLEITGQADLVRHVACTDNRARVRDLARLPELRAWLAAAGLTLDEAARIQPEYCFVTQALECFCKDGDRDVVAVGTVVQSGEATLRLRIDRIDGDFPGATVGSELSLSASGRVGEQILVTRDSAGEIYVIGDQLSIDGTSVRCDLNRDTVNRPVSVDTVIAGLLREPSSCVEVFASDDSGWNRSQCDVSQPDHGGCGLSREDESAGAAGLASLALFMALAAHRRRR
jgi:hypothetical protein